MIVPINAKFLTSAASIADAPSFAMSEVAFLGRSNVGKSSLINALLARKGLAKSSSTPGKTQLINFFDVAFQSDAPLGLRDEILNVNSGGASNDRSFEQTCNTCEDELCGDGGSKVLHDDRDDDSEAFHDGHSGIGEKAPRGDRDSATLHDDRDNSASAHLNLVAQNSLNSSRNSLNLNTQNFLNSSAENPLNSNTQNSLNLAATDTLSKSSGSFTRAEKDAKCKEKFSLIFVDLPGFGYAKVSKKLHHIWQKNLDEFIKNRLEIKLFVHLIDARQFDLAIDKNLQNYLASFLRGDQKVVRLYTKCDKLNQSERTKLLRHDPQAVLVSTLKGSGLAKAREIIVRGALGL